jgi:hypothetical protein
VWRVKTAREKPIIVDPTTVATLELPKGPPKEALDLGNPELIAGANGAPVKTREGGVSLPTGPWLGEIAGFDALKAPFADPFLESQRQSFVAILSSGLPERAALVKASIKKRLESPAALYRGIADWRDATIMAELEGREYVGRAGFVLNSEDGHAYQPNTVWHHGEGRVMSIGDSDRVGCAPYELELRSWMASLQLIGHNRHFSPATCAKVMDAFLGAYTEGIKSVAKAEDPEKAAKALRITEDSPPDVLKPYFDKAGGKSHEDWLKKVLDKEPIRFASNPEKLIPLATDVPGQKIRAAIIGALPDYLKQLDPDERKKL